MRTIHTILLAACLAALFSRVVTAHDVARGDAATQRPITFCDPTMVDGRCLCFDNPIGPSACGCALTPDGCECEGAVYPDYACGWKCIPGASGDCECGGIPAPLDWCAHTCELVPLTGGGDEHFKCLCSGLEADPALCGCLDFDGQCECSGDAHHPATCAEEPCDWDPLDPDDCKCGEIDAPSEFCQV